MKAKKYSPFAWTLALVLGLMFVLSLAGLLYGNYLAGDSALWQMIISGILLSIPLILLYASIGILAIATRQKHIEGQLQTRLVKLIYWAPRIAGIVIILFVSLFALDVFSEGYTLGEMLIGFVMHMLPSIALMIILALAWRWEWIGFLAFLGAATFFFLMVIRSSAENFGALLLFAGPMFVIALLFGANWQWRAELHQTPKPASN